MHFEECDRMITEGSPFSRPFALHFLRPTQNPFTILLRTTTVDSAEALGLEQFILSESIDATSRATASRSRHNILLSVCICFYMSFNTGSDFMTSTITVTVPANSGTYQLPQFFSVVDDNTNEPDQLFTVVAEIGPDVPEGTSCFKVNEYDTSCFGRRGATRIIIKDNDRKLNKISELRSSFTICLAMVIGFTERSGTVSEAAGLPSQLFRLNIGVSSLRTSEIEHPITFRVREDRSTANVQPLGSVGLSDAFFGSFRDRDVLFVLGSGIQVIPPLTTFIVDDITVEIDECFTIRMFFTHTPETREPRVTCNDGDGATNFFCEHTVCIEDNDGINRYT